MTYFTELKLHPRNQESIYTLCTIAHWFTSQSTALASANPCGPAKSSHQINSSTLQSGLPPFLPHFSRFPCHRSSGWVNYFSSLFTGELHVKKRRVGVRRDALGNPDVRARAAIWGTAGPSDRRKRNVFLPGGQEEGEDLIIYCCTLVDLTFHGGIHRIRYTYDSVIYRKKKIGMILKFYR